MDALYNVRRVSIRPLLVGLTVLFALVLGLLAGYAVARIDAGAPPAAPTRVIAPLISTQGPDAQERNARLRQQLAAEDTTHGH